MWLKSTVCKTSTKEKATAVHSSSGGPHTLLKLNNRHRAYRRNPWEQPRRSTYSRSRSNSKVKKMAKASLRIFTGVRPKVPQSQLPSCAIIYRQDSTQQHSGVMCAFFPRLSGLQKGHFSCFCPWQLCDDKGRLLWPNFLKLAHARPGLCAWSRVLSLCIYIVTSKCLTCHHLAFFLKSLGGTSLVHLIAFLP